MRGKLYSRLIFACILTCFFSCSSNSPIHNYNICTGGVNAASALFTDLSGHLNRLYQDSIAPSPSVLKDHYTSLLAYQRGLLEEVRSVDNEEAQQMVNASAKYLSFTQETGNSDTFTSILNILDSGRKASEMVEDLDVHGEYLERMFDQEQILYEDYYEAMSTYASKNGIDESLWKRSE